MCKFLRSELKVATELSNAWYLEVGDDLRVLVVKYAPHVVCSPHPYTRDATVPWACQGIIDYIKVSKDVEIFAQRSVYDRDLETPLPIYAVSPAQGSTNLLNDSQDE